MDGLSFLFGVCIGAVVVAVFYRVFAIGVFRGNLIIDDSDPEQTCMFLETSKTDISALKHSRHVIFRVVKRN